MEMVTSEISKKMASLKSAIEDFRSNHRKFAPFPVEIRQKVVDLVGMGILIPVVAKVCGLNRSQVCRWQQMMQSDAVHRSKTSSPPKSIERRILSIVPAVDDQSTSDIRFSLHAGKLSINISA